MKPTANTVTIARFVMRAKVSMEFVLIDAWLRKRLGERKLLGEITRIVDTERRKVQWHLHNISRAIVRQAKELRAVILLGDLKGIRSHAKGRRMNRIVFSMPYYTLSKMIESKALWEGIPLVYGDEAGSSKTCHFCNSEGIRVGQGLFRCHLCGHEYNADANGAYNMGRRLWKHIFQSGAIGSGLIRGASDSSMCR